MNWLTLDPPPTVSPRETQKHKAQHQAGRSPLASSAPARKTPLPLAALKPDLTMHESTSPRNTASSGAYATDNMGMPNDDNPNARWGEGGADFRRIEDATFMQTIYRDVESGLIYPGILAAHGLSGTVNARLVYNGQGACDWRQMSISSSESHLRVYILDVLKQFCHVKFARYMRGRKSLNVDLSFTFEITEHNDEALIEKQKMLIGNVLLFYRNSQHSVAEWKLGPLHGLFPIPFVSLDFAWLMQNWDKINGHPVDEL